MPTLTIPLKVKPNCRRLEPPCMKEGVLHLGVNAPPVDGKANLAVIARLAEWLDVPKSAIDFSAGTSSRQKRVVVTASAEKIAAMSQQLAASV